MKNVIQILRFSLKKVFIIILMMAVIHQIAIAQTKGVRVNSEEVKNIKTGKTYALIVGISKYADKAMPQLQFSDRDAVFFFNYLRSKTGGNVDTSNLRILLNSQAKSSDIWRELQWIIRRADSSDRVYVYFSGHGDGSTNTEDVYLLTYETSKVDDAGLYVPSSALPVINLKTKLKTLMQRDVEVVFITDACRTNELPGKGKGAELLYRNIMDENLGALQTQVASCKANQESQEGIRWGKGRGVFSYYLVNGLYGFADNEPVDGKVTFEELESYVKENVKRETKSLSTGEPLQVPVFIGPNKVLSFVNEEDKKLVASGQSESDEMVHFASRRSTMIRSKMDTSVYNRFQETLNEEHLINPPKNNASYWLDSLLKGTDDKIFRADVTDELIASLMNKGQEPIRNFNNSLFESNYYTNEYFLTGAAHFKAAQLYLKNNPEMYKLADASRMFLEARALEKSEDKNDWEKGLLMMDSTLAIYKWPYAIHTKSLLFQRLNMNDSVIRNESNAIAYAPVWSGGYSTIGLSFARLSFPDSAKYYLRKSIQLNPGDENAYVNMGVVFLKQRAFDSSIYFSKKGLEINPGNSSTYNNIGLCFEEYRQTDSAIVNYKKAIEMNPKDEYPCFNLGNVYGSINKFDSAAYYFQKAIDVKSSMSDAHYNLGLVYYYSKHYEKAIDAFKHALENSPGFGDAMYLIVCCNSLKKDKAGALKYTELLLQKGLNYFEDSSKDTDLNYISKSKEFSELVKKYSVIQK